MRDQLGNMRRHKNAPASKAWGVDFLPGGVALPTGPVTHTAAGGKGRL